jgi:hypothetical protein
VPTVSTVNIATDDVSALIQAYNNSVSSLGTAVSAVSMISGLTLVSTGLRLSGSLAVSGSAALSSTLGVASGVALSSTLVVTSGVTLSGPLAVASQVTASGPVQVAGSGLFSSTLQVTSGVTLSSTLVITSAVTLSAGLTVGGWGTFSGMLSVASAAVFSGLLTVMRGLIGSSTLTIASLATLSGPLTVAGSATVSGALGVGLVVSAYPGQFAVSSLFQLYTSTNTGYLIVRESDDVGGAIIELVKLRSGVSVVQNGDRLGTLVFGGANGASFAAIGGARVAADVDGVASTAGVPTALILQTTASGSTTATTRLKITASGLVGVNTLTPSAVFQVSGSALISGSL